MSLTGLLRDKGAIHTFLSTLSSDIYAAVGKSDTASAARARLGFTSEVNAETVVPRPLNTDRSDAAVVGTAFDYRARMMLDANFDIETTTALSGLLLIEQNALGSIEAEVFREVFTSCGQLVSRGRVEDLDLAAIGLAWLEQAFRSGVTAFIMGRTAARAREIRDGAALLRDVPRALLKDMARLRVLGGGLQIDDWQRMIKGGTPLVANPGFSGSYLVGGADGDWIIGDMLVDCKVTGQVTSPSLREHLLQLLGYVMLDLVDQYAIRSVGLWLPRQGRLVSWRLDALLGDGRSLTALRAEFLRIAEQSSSALALRDEKLQDKMELLMATNLHTPFELLDSYASSEKMAVRRRIASNTSTMTETLVRLAQDERTEVRAAVARNKSTPPALRAELAEDPRVAVRRAATAMGAEVATRPGRKPSPRAIRPRLTDEQAEGLLDRMEKGYDRSGLLAEDGGYGLRLWTVLNMQSAGILDYAQLLDDSWPWANAVGQHWGRECQSLLKDGYEIPFASGSVPGDMAFLAEFHPSEHKARLREELRREEIRLARELAADSMKEVVLPRVEVLSAHAQRIEDLRDESLDTAAKEVLIENAASSEDPRLRKQAVALTEDISLLLRMVWDPRWEVRFQVMNSRLCPEGVSAYLAGDRSIMLRRRVAASMATASTVLDALVKNNDDTEVLSGIGRNPNTSDWAFGALAESDDVSVVYAVAENRRAPERVLLDLAVDPRPRVRGTVAMNFSTPVSGLLSLSQDTDLGVVLRVCLNPMLPLDTLERLSMDEDPPVRRLAGIVLSIRRLREGLRQIDM